MASVTSDGNLCVFETLSNAIVVYPAGTVFNQSTGSTLTTPVQNNTGYTGVLLFLEITANSGTTPTLTPSISMINPTTGTARTPNSVWTNIGTTNRLYLYHVYPGVTTQAYDGVLNGALPQQWVFNLLNGGTNPSYTFSLTYQYLP